MCTDNFAGLSLYDCLPALAIALVPLHFGMTELSSVSNTQNSSTVPNRAHINTFFIQNDLIFCLLLFVHFFRDTLYTHGTRFRFILTAVKVRLSGNSSIVKVALAAYFHRAHYNSPMALAAYFCRSPVSCGISRAVPKVSETSTGGAARTDQLTRRPRLVFIIAHIIIAFRRSPFSLMVESIYRHTSFPKRVG
jgi:hypothetical protein